MLYKHLNLTKSDIQISLNTENAYNMSAKHFHSSYEIYYLIEGTRKYFIDDKVYTVNPKNLVVIPPNVIHKTMDTGVAHTRLLFNINRSFFQDNLIGSVLEDAFNNNSVLILNSKLQKEIEIIFNNINLELSKCVRGYEYMIKSEIVKMLIFIGRYQTEVGEKRIEMSGTDNKVFEIIQYIRNNYDKPISLTTIAEIFYINKHYLSRIFKKVTCFTVVEYINSVRVIKAQDLLLSSNKNMLDIAFEVGFNSMSNFGKVFKANTGISPREYKAKHAKSIL